jgi:hypothetical protein
MGTVGVAEAADRIAVALANAGDRREEYWTNRVKPLLEQVWPKSAAFRSSDESCALAEICIRAGRQFEDALDFISPWLRQAPGCRLIAMHLDQTDIPRNTPASALKLLAAIIDTNQPASPSNLRIVLDKIGSADPTLRNAPAFRRLLNHVEQFALD